MAQTPAVIAKILLDNKKFRAQLTQTGRMTGQTLGKVANNFRRTITGITAATGVMLAGVVTVNKSFKSLEASTGVLAVGFGKSQREMLLLAKSMHDEGLGRGEKKFEDIVSALQSLQEQGIETADEAAATLPQYQVLADALGITLTDAVDQVGHSLRAMGEPLNSAWKYSDAYTAASRVAGIETSTFSAFLRDNAEALKTSNLSIIDVSAALVHLDAKGTSGANAMSLLGEAVQQGSTFSEVFYDKIGLTSDALDLLSERVGAGNLVTREYAAVVRDTADGIDKAGRAIEITTIGYGELIKLLQGGSATLDTQRQGFTLLAEHGVLSVQSLADALRDYNAELAESARRLQEVRDHQALLAINRGEVVPGGPPPPQGVAAPPPNVYLPEVLQPSPPQQGVPPPRTSPFLSELDRQFRAPLEATITKENSTGTWWSDGIFVPKHGDGGITTGPHMAMVGEAGPEAIIPLDRLADILSDGLSMGQGSVNTIDALGGGGGGGGPSVNITIMEAHFRDGRDLLEMARSKGLAFQ